MSTKIYVAYRLPIGRLNDFLDATRANAWKDFLGRTEQLVHGLKQSYVEEYKKGDRWQGFDFDTKPEWANLYVRWEIIREMYKEASASYEKGLNADAGWNIWLHDDGYAYCIYWGREYKHGAQGLDFAEFFGYWDNTDPPEDTPSEVFSARGDVWEDVCLGDETHWNNRRLYHAFIDFSPTTCYASIQVERHLGLW